MAKLQVKRFYPPKSVIKLYYNLLFFLRPSDVFKNHWEPWGRSCRAYLGGKGRNGPVVIFCRSSNLISPVILNLQDCLKANISRCNGQKVFGTLCQIKYRSGQLTFYSPKRSFRTPFDFFFSEGFPDSLGFFSKSCLSISFCKPRPNCLLNASSSRLTLGLSVVPLILRGMTFHPCSSSRIFMVASQPFQKIRIYFDKESEEGVLLIY